VRTRCGRWLMPLSSGKTIVRPSLQAFLEWHASAAASIARRPSRRAPPPGPPASGN
jgi:hypothetical protein